MCAHAGCTISGQTLTCDTVPSVAAGAQLVYVVPITASSQGSFVFSGQVTCDLDGNTANNGPTSDTLSVTRTCLRYNSDGSRFPCNALFKWNNTARNDPNPSMSVCCTDAGVDPNSGPDVSLTGSIQGPLKVGERGNAVFKVTAEEGNFDKGSIFVTITVPPSLKVLSLPSGEALLV